MSIDPDFLRLLACPATRQPLRQASAEQLQRLNAAIQQGSVTNRGGSRVERPVQDGLVADDGSVLYPIQDGIPILLTAEGMSLPAAATASHAEQA